MPWDSVRIGITIYHNCAAISEIGSTAIPISEQIGIMADDFKDFNYLAGRFENNSERISIPAFLMRRRDALILQRKKAGPLKTLPFKTNLHRVVFLFPDQTNPRSH